MKIPMGTGYMKDLTVAAWAGFLVLGLVFAKPARADEPPRLEEYYEKIKADNSSESKKGDSQLTKLAKELDTIQATTPEALIHTRGEPASLDSDPVIQAGRKRVREIQEENLKIRKAQQLGASENKFVDRLKLEGVVTQDDLEKRISLDSENLLKLEVRFKNFQARGTTSAEDQAAQGKVLIELNRLKEDLKSEKAILEKIIVAVKVGKAGVSDSKSCRHCSSRTEKGKSPEGTQPQEQEPSKAPEAPSDTKPGK